MGTSVRRISVVLMMLFGTNFCWSQSMQHPVIWVTQDEKQDILNLIEKYDWAKKMEHDLHAVVDKKVEAHQKKPSVILSHIPEIPADNSLTEFEAVTVGDHAAVLTDASYAAMLYFLTDDEKYAQFSADVLWHYVTVLSDRSPKNTTICGNHFYDPRTSYAQFALAYDFIYNFLNKPTTKVYKASANKQQTFDRDLFQKVLLNMVGSSLQEYGRPDTHGKFISNHPILTAPGVLYGILCIEDDKERERLFDVFWEKGTAHQNSFKNTILPMFGKQGIWPESTSYSFMPAVTLVLNIIDRVYPEMQVTQNYKNIYKGNFLFDNLRMPDGRFVRYGDSKRNHDGTEQLYRYTLNLAQRRGYSNLENQAKIALSQAYQRQGGYQSKISPATFNSSEPLKLFWGTPIPKGIDSKIDFKKPTVLVEHAGIALQRNYVETDNELYGLCGIIGGAHYVHSHVTGITMELYGAGYVMAPNGGLPKTVKERRIPLHENYFRLYAGNNTVIVNGTSHGIQPGSWKDGAYVWQNTVVNIAAEPKHLEDPISEHFNFATQFLKDTINNCDQERTLSTIRTSEKTGYYLDVFRSKSLTENKFQDYIYHNIGDATLLETENGETLRTEPTTRYKTDIGDPVQSPGWRYFEDTKSTKPIHKGVHATFKIDYDERFMHMFVPQGVNRSYTTALAPPTREAKNGYEEKPTQVLAIRQDGEAWEKPFIAVFEPSVKASSSVQTVTPLQDADKVVGVTVISKVNGKLITDYIISLDSKDGVYENKILKIKFEGRFGIIRVEGEQKTISLYIGEGKTLKYNNYTLDSETATTAYKVF
ncbi:conserved hypothetical protein [Formosa agariphila KMM 3901]|uniref:Endo-acting ulvan lyase n=1 Tax=Formosa agariphila (strain DSM 15362 / KCTC 12365 / LMG 23005 / KMM 3901 / M-2Alg 35-1) TaxID=1347342 RepID=PLH10_FORAG|nr:hypothetical protein [Formosa agariphila]T2KNA3.1 RecName: Full=Endo-acting ulvan lyase; AltName: Full=Endolytic ulvan lyase; AltName: Full=P10_PLnc; AltName: Full=Polysaccharide utilization locus H protein P10; Short=PUL H protein P10; Flags: Precursor [Formosa agariphila KMM 3901]CDF79911.1 conserved hypothetical protein [Formosa agariphila KMM 3901]